MTITSTVRRLALLAAAALVVTLLPLAGASAQPEGDGPFGLDHPDASNTEISINWSATAYPDAAVAADEGPTEALIGRSDNFADNLASGSLQGGTDTGRPLLLTGTDALDESVADELARLGGPDVITTVHLLGGTAALDEAVADELDELGYTTNRFEGETRTETAIDIAGAVGGDTAILARAFTDADDATQAFADSLAAGAWAAEADVPVLFTETDVLTGNTADHITDAGYANIIIVGGEAAVSADVEAEVAALVDSVERVAGATRFETAVAVANERGFASAAAADLTVLVDGQGANSWADGFSAANVAGNGGYPLVLANSASDALPDVTADFLSGDSTAAFANAHLDPYVLICGGTVPDDQCAEAAGLVGVAEEDIIALEDAGFTTPDGGGLTDGRVTLDSGTAMAGGTITGTIADAGEVQSVSVTGCGFNNEAVSVGGTGGFTLTIPAGQAAGPCTLTFAMLLTDGTSETATFNITVTAAAVTTTDAPDLVSATVSGGNVTYLFDEPIAFVVPGGRSEPAVPPAVGVVFPDFRVYNAAGNPSNPTALTIGPGGDTVIAQFTTAVAGAATLATVLDDAVEDSTGIRNYPSGAAVGAGASAPGITAAPDLQSVSNLRTQAGEIVADFRFDEAVDSPVASPIGPMSVLNDSFFLIASDGLRHDSEAVRTVSADGRSLTVAFDPAVTTVPLGTITRGGVFASGVEDATGNLNPLQTEARTGTPPFSPGATADRSTDPDLVSVQVVGTNTVAFTFDEPVQSSLTSTVIVPTLFNVYDSAANEVGGVTATRSPTQFNVVNVNFPVGAVGAAVGASADRGAVLANDNSRPNTEHELPLQTVASTAGRTALPDLVSVRVTIDAFQSNTVRFTFDQPLTVIPGADELFELVNAQGVAFIQTGALVTTVATNLTYVEFTNVFTTAQAADAVIGAQQDTTGGGPGLQSITEGDVPVTRP